MPTPFPGMDPYLERRGLWEGVHTRLIVAIADALAPLVRPAYRVDVEQRTYDLAIDYSRPVVPPLPEEDAAWAAKMIDQRHKEPVG